MSMDYIRSYYGVPAKRGALIMFNGKVGSIVGSRGQYLRVRFDGKRFPAVIHPTWEVRYL